MPNTSETVRQFVIRALQQYHERLSTAEAEALEITLNDFVAKEEGKGLSTEDFTTALLNKLNEIEAGAQVNVHPDWNETNISSYSYILNKPNLDQYALVSDLEESEEATASSLVDLNTRLSQIEGVNVTGIEYDSTNKLIKLKSGDTVIGNPIDATDFIKDGMIDTVTIGTPSEGTNTGVDCLIITFNTDAGKEDIEIPISRIFNPNNYYTKTESDELFTTYAYTYTNYVQKDGNKVLSTNDFTNAYMAKLDAIEPNAQVNVQANWNETDNTKDSYILNKPDLTQYTLVSDFEDSEAATATVLLDLNTRLSQIETDSENTAYKKHDLTNSTYISQTYYSSTYGVVSYIGSLADLSNAELNTIFNISNS